LEGVLADHTARNIIGYWHHNVVCLSVSLFVGLSVTLSIVAKQYILQRQCRNKWI